MKTFVINEQESTRIPFLRGILIRSLLDAGLDFDEALELATRVRDDLDDVTEISSDKIRHKVHRLLEESGHLGAMEPYRLPLVAPARIQVESLSGTVSSFSRAKHERYLQASGMKAEKAERTTVLIYDHLLAAGISSITTCQLGFLTWLCLKQEVSKKAAKRYLVWSEYQRSARPLALLICGSQIARQFRDAFVELVNDSDEGLVFWGEGILSNSLIDLLIDFVVSHRWIETDLCFQIGRQLFGGP